MRARTGRFVVVGSTELASQIYIQLAADSRSAEQLERVERISDFNLEERIVPPAVLILAGNEVEENLALALDAVDRWPETRLILRFFNKALGEELERLSPRIRVLSASEISAPSFAAHALAVDVIGAWREPDGRIRIERAGGAPAPDAGWGAGQSHSGGVQLTFIRSMQEFLRDPWVLRVLFGILLLIALASVYFSMSLGLRAEDAVYFVVTTLTTTGYGDISLLNSGFFAKLAGILVMLGGTTLSGLSPEVRKKTPHNLYLKPRLAHLGTPWGGVKAG
jgi:hypothetical protein